MAEHLPKIKKNNERMPHYLGNRIQNGIIDIVSNKIKNIMKKILKNSKYYSIILDFTPDVTHRKQITVIVRFVYFNPINGEVHIKEHFLGFCEVFETTGTGLTNFVLDFLNTENVNIFDMRGQGYDNGANMRGKSIGLKKQILNISPRAFFVPCASHTPNLVVNDAAKVFVETLNFFSIVQKLYFFSSSTNRWQILIKQVKNLTLKPLSDTRWESR